ncbi:POU domain, class 6, transcription factor 1 [Larimichthys crocea]|uniref:Uncharacterized protein n=1 Tax=Larimichthys crocea TaxID=215358 RepID=A0ACD3R9V7_LARCR|nr:POU domain, class 6, transcription factor 1 [Larimichthys crocea]
MNSQDLPAKDAPLTVNEQVIVMSGHETIRVLEVEVDASLPSSVPDGKSEGKSEEGVAQPAEQPGVGSTQDGLALPQSAGGVVLGEQQVVSVEAPAPAVQTLTPAVPVSMSLPQPQAAMPITVQGCPQLLFPAFAAANAAGNLLKLPFAGLQAATVLSSVQPQLHTNAQTMFQPQASIQPMQAAVQQVTSQPTQVTNAQVTAAQMAAAQATQATTTVSQSNLSLAALQTAGLSINPAIVRMPLRGFPFCTESYMPSYTCCDFPIRSTPPPWELSHSFSVPSPLLPSSPVPCPTWLASPSQIITNAQGQVIGTLPLLVNPASLAGGAATSTLPLQGLQVQTVTPQLLLNTQGQIIATVGNGPAAVVTSAAVLPKATAPPTLTKPNTQALVTTATQAPVVIAPQPSVLKTATTLSSTVPITCGDIAKVGQLVGKPAADSQQRRRH